MTPEEYKNYKGTCIKCGHPVICQYGEQINSEMVENEVCFLCNIKREQFNFVLKGDKTPEGYQVIRCRNCHYIVGDPNQRGERGFGGQKFKFKLLKTGEIIETTNLWYQGEIPELWRPLLKDNAIQIVEPECLREATPSSTVEGVSS